MPSSQRHATKQRVSQIKKAHTFKSLCATQIVPASSLRSGASEWCPGPGPSGPRDQQLRPGRSCSGPAQLQQLPGQARPAAVPSAAGANNSGGPGHLPGDTCRCGGQPLPAHALQSLSAAGDWRAEQASISIACVCVAYLYLACVCHKLHKRKTDMSAGVVDCISQYFQSCLPCQADVLQLHILSCTAQV